ncbi:hypothetical protein NE865_06668 [Phthorimaea operculella]|nr:hypothetical protein NE865_06668 [Phthorimaea operculella]
MSATSIAQQLQANQSKNLFKRTSFAATTQNKRGDDDDDLGMHMMGDNLFKNTSITSTKSARSRMSNASAYQYRDSVEDTCCSCNRKASEPSLDPKLLEEKLKEQEEELRQEFSEAFHREIGYLKERFNFILQNEQARASCMLREAHRERKEKIAALQQQLECKNMAGLMYVMCAERTKCKVEKMLIIETYTRYINMLNDILTDGQELILNLSRGYKSAARVNHEWQEKTKKLICEFKQFIGNFTGSPPDQNQYLLDMPKLLEIEEPIDPDPEEDPIDEDPPEPVDPDDLVENKEWWQRLDEVDRPFAVYGDMADFKPPQRREALKRVKAAKTAPKKWKEYMFHDMFLLSDCPNAERMKREYFDRVPQSPVWEDMSPTAENDYANLKRRQTSVDLGMLGVKGNGTMGSILKIMTSTAGQAEPVTKANLLGARDSMEIASSTKIRDKSRSIMHGSTRPSRAQNKQDVIVVGQRKVSHFVDNIAKMDALSEHSERAPASEKESGHRKDPKDPKAVESGYLRDFQTGRGHDDDMSLTDIVSKELEHTDSLVVIPKHVPDPDHVINYEKTCPVKSCQRRHVDTLMKGLPRYMTASPFTHFEETFDQYETCSPEQLAMLKQRIDEKKRMERQEYKDEVVNDPLLDWRDSVPGLGTQTSDLSYLEAGLPPCTCRDPAPTPTSSQREAVFKVEDLLPVKAHLDKVTRECLYDDQIEFQRFKVIGQESKESLRAKAKLNQIKQNFTQDRLREIQKILKQHPSLLDLFQANNRC